MIVDVVLEAGLDLPCLIVNPELGDVPDLGGCAAEAGLGLDLDLALVAVADRPVRLLRIGPPQGAGLQKLAPPRIKRRQAVISLLPQLLRLRHLADVEVRKIDLVQQVIEQRLVSAAFEFCLAARQSM